MIDVAVTGEGRVRIARLTVLNDDGVTDAVGLQVTENTDGGWLVLSREKALDLAVRLMAHAGGES